MSKVPAGSPVLVALAISPVVAEMTLPWSPGQDRVGCCGGAPDASPSSPRRGDHMRQAIWGGRWLGVC